MSLNHLTGASPSVNPPIDIKVNRINLQSLNSSTILGSDASKNIVSTNLQENKIVTTDTNQTITGIKTFQNGLLLDSFPNNLNTYSVETHTLTLTGPNTLVLNCRFLKLGRIVFLFMPTGLNNLVTSQFYTCSAVPNKYFPSDPQDFSVRVYNSATGYAQGISTGYSTMDTLGIIRIYGGQQTTNIFNSTFAGVGNNTFTYISAT